MREDDLPGHIGELIRHGRIASVDLAAGRITVALGELTTGPIRWFTGGAGGTRVWSRPKVGEQVTLFAPDGDIAGAVALRGVTCDAYPHLGDENREVIRFEDGAVIAYDPAAHKLEAVLPGGGSVALIAPGGITIDADVRIKGDVTLDGTLAATGDVKAGDISLQKHTHLGVQPGGGKSGLPQ